MASAHDVGVYILQEQGAMSPWRLQKLVYYAQAWHLVWDEEPLYASRIEAWANGPVVRELYRQHRGLFTLNRLAIGDLTTLTESERQTVELVLASYGRLTGRQLSHLTRSERPWSHARDDLPSTDASSAEITTDRLYDFYSTLDADDEARSVYGIDWPSAAHFEKPVFSFGYVDDTAGNGWGWDLRANGEAQTLMDFLCEMSQLTWQEIQTQAAPRRSGATRPKHRAQQINQIAKDAQARLRTFKLDETFGDEMFRFCLAGTRRLWGFQDGRTFHAVWWDPHHLIYELDETDLLSYARA